MVFWINRRPFYPTPGLFLASWTTNYAKVSLSSKKNQVVLLSTKLRAEIRLFVQKPLKRGKAWKKFFLSLRAFFRMFLNSFEVLAKNFHEKCMFFAKNWNRVRFRLFWKISQNPQNLTLFNNKIFFESGFLMSHGGSFPLGVKLHKCKKVYPKCVVAQRLSLLKLRGHFNYILSLWVTESHFLT